jgi:hypothetical protein
MSLYKSRKSFLLISFSIVLSVPLNWFCMQNSTFRFTFYFFSNLSF